MSILESATILLAISFILVLLGVLLIFVGSLKKSDRETSRVEGGGVIIVGPIPIVIGSSEKISKILVILAIILTILTFIVFLYTSRLLEPVVVQP